MTFLVLFAFTFWPILHRGHARQSPEQPVVARIRVESGEKFAQLTAAGVDLLEMRDGNDLFTTFRPQDEAMPLVLRDVTPCC
ncbi:MAG TPA: hypothetical protein VNO70_14785 [Blastocatellia bacterium]|nr:hypothetical protein [Blastocatellia bacterium]